MANLIEMSEQLKGVPDDWLQQQIQNPSGAVPPYLMLGEMNRRKSLRSRMTQPPTTTVAEDVLRSGQPAPPGMASTDVLGARQPQQPQTPRPGVPSPVPGGLSAAAPPAPQGPPAPQRMAAGGLIRAYGGTLIDPYAKFRQSTPTKEEEEEKDRINQYYETVPAPGGMIVRLPGAKDMFMPSPPKPEYPAYREPSKVDIKMPDLASVLEQVRSVTREPEGASAKLDQRIAELEQQRSNIRQPRTGDALIEMGLGMMGSRSPYALQALGEAGLGAVQSHRTRQLQANQQQTALSERLAAIEAARYEQQERGRRSDLSAAQELASKQYGAEMVKAQLDSQAESRRSAWELAQAQSGNQWNRDVWDQQTAMQKAIAQGVMQQGRDNIDPLSPEGRAMKALQLEDAAKIASRYRPPSAAAEPKLPAEWRFRDDAAALIQQEAFKWQVGGEDTPDTLIGRVKRGVADDLRRGKRLGHLPQIYREAMADKVDVWSPDKDGRDEQFWGDITKRVATDKKAVLEAGAKADREKEKKEGERKYRLNFLQQPPAGARIVNQQFGGLGGR